jgi:hypothetical protein
LIGWLLVSGLVVFTVGAARWRLQYEQPLEISLPLKAWEAGRLRWIHHWMLVGLVLSSAGVAAFATFAQSPWGGAAAVVFAMGATAMLVGMAFRLTVGEWAAKETVARGSVPHLYPTLSGWAGSLHAIHMVTAYASAIPLGWVMFEADIGPAWVEWVGMLWGALYAIGFVLTRGGAVFAPPIQAHLFTGALGLTLLLT